MAKTINASKLFKRGSGAVSGANKISKFKRGTSLLGNKKRIRVKPTKKQGIVPSVKAKKSLQGVDQQIKPLSKDTKIGPRTKISRIVKNVANNILPDLKQEVREDTEKITDPNSLFNSIFSGGLGEIDRFGSALDKMSRTQLPFLERASKLAVDFVEKLASGKSGGGFLRTVGNIIKVIAAAGVADIAAPFVLTGLAAAGVVAGAKFVGKKIISGVKAVGNFFKRKGKEVKDKVQTKSSKFFASSLDKLESIMTFLEKKQEPKEEVQPPEGEKKKTSVKPKEGPLGVGKENATIEITDDGKFVVTRNPTTVEEESTEEEKPQGLLRAVAGIADTFTGGIFDFDKRGDTKFQDMGQSFVDSATLGSTDFDEEGRSPVQNVIQNIFGLVRKGLKGDKGEKGNVGIGGDRGLTGKDIVSRVMGIKDQATEFTLNLPATKFAKKLLDTGVNAILGGPVMGEEIRSRDDMQQLQLNVPSEVTTSKVETDLKQLQERKTVATDVSKTAKAGASGGQPSIVPLGMDSGGQPKMKPNHNVQQMNQAGNKIPILGSIDTKNMHIPSTYAVFNIIDANNGI